MPKSKDTIIRPLGATKLPLDPTGKKSSVPTKIKKPLVKESSSERGAAKNATNVKKTPPSTSKAVNPKTGSQAEGTKDKRPIPPRKNPFDKSKWEKLKVKKKKPEPRQVHGKVTRYRRSIRLRLRARIMIFFGALGILLLERYFGFLFQLDDFKDAYYNQMGIDPWKVEIPPWKLLAPIQPIHALTYSPAQPCTGNLLRIINVHNPKYHKIRQIPLIVHQTSKTRCLTRNFERAARDWHFQDWSYYLHDDQAVDKLLHIEFPEFPYLKLVVDKCVLSTTTRIYLWQYLVLWMYGGLYVDLNLYPLTFNATTIRDSDDGFFFTEPESHKLSTRFMAVSPRHPLIFYAVEQALATILQSRDAGSIDPYKVFGEENLHKALLQFTKATDHESSLLSGSVPDGIIRGYDGRSIRVVGAINGPENYVEHVFIGTGRSVDYEKMGHRRKRGVESTESCFQRIWT